MTSNVTDNEHANILTDNDVNETEISGANEAETSIVNDETNLVEKNEQVKYQKTERRSSFILNIIPGRRSSATIQFVKVHRRREATIEEEDQTIEEDSEVVIQDGKEAEKSWIKRKLALLKKGIVDGLKNIKFFVK